MVWKPRVTVASVIENSGRFLMVEEMQHGQLTINQPAGHMEYGESVIDAVRRETLEETGWIFEPTALLGVLQRYHDDPNRVFLRFTFTGHIVEQLKDYEIDSDITAVHWLTREQIYNQQPQIWRSKMVGMSLDLYDSGIRYPVDMLHYIGG